MPCSVQRNLNYGQKWFSNWLSIAFCPLFTYLSSNRLTCFVSFLHLFQVCSHFCNLLQLKCHSKNNAVIFNYFYFWCLMHGKAFVIL
ncbi:hypothetical protein XENTR_v10014200 [Xenopus tropicalis]|nr:hypothetical protein XENTR_v10014200 [Xenopus tropicalis]